MNKVMLGVPSYGRQEAVWWSRISEIMSRLPEMGLQSGGLANTGSMLTDNNRNMIVKNFLESDSDWLFWVDADTIPPMGALKRLMETGKKMVTGLYFSKKEPYTPIAYYRQADNRYQPIGGWKRGEILPVDSAGMGCLLIHRSVYESIEKQYTVFQRSMGGITAVHNDDIKGKVKFKTTKNDNKVRDGVLQMRLWEPAGDYLFPFYVLEYARTEDMWFFEMADRAGHQLWLDTGVECQHIGKLLVDGDTYVNHVLVENFGDGLDMPVVLYD